MDQAIRFIFSTLQGQGAREPRVPATAALLDLGGEIVRGMKIARAENQVTLTFRRPPSFDRLGEHLAAAIEAAETARQRARAEQTISPLLDPE